MSFSVYGNAGANARGQTAQQSEGGTILDIIVGEFRQWLYLPDPGALLVVLATVVANLLPGDPVWLLLIGPPSSGKTELLYALRGLPKVPFNVRFVSTLTGEAALLSGSGRLDRRLNASGGLLREIGEFGFLVFKDFGSLLAMKWDRRCELLAAFREIYDGKWHRPIGGDGGRTLTWEGKLGLIGGCTEAIDAAHSVTSQMGERFLFFRLPPVDTCKQARCALRRGRGAGTEMRTELAGAASGLFDFIEIPKSMPPHDKVDEERLIALASLAVTCRSAVERDWHSDQITLVPQPEAPARLVCCLSRLLTGFDVIGLGREETWKLLVKVGLDCMPATRCKIVNCLRKQATGLAATSIGELVKLPERTTRRNLDELELLEIVVKEKFSSGSPGAPPEYWSLSGWTTEQLAIAEGRLSVLVDDGEEE